ncbi:MULTISPECIES: hypothetical protein [unclassified Streptomyces]|uniref:hypothetical protein n=1 Tax=unclassified Streptomyces TaxID=2593676 RepID=UPI0013BFB05A|nr:hypothetical protein [Streptomyces sp. SID10853]NDZ79586.1 hypothetical protein [Streptomyces sp. SID10853]WSU46259.1 hypothetical protein OG510_36215 [Streptomyces sp. NBC_01089]
MSEEHVQVAEADADRESPRDESLIDYSRRRQAVALIVAPIIFGVLAGLTLKWSVVAWGTMQVIGVLGAVVAGREHKYGWSAAARGFVAGLLATGVTVGMQALLPGDDVKTLAFPSYLITAAIGSAVLHLVGAAPRRIRRRIKYVATLRRTR